MRMGVGGYFVTVTDNVGVSVEGTYKTHSDWEASLAYTYVPEKNLQQWNLIDLDAHYIFLHQSKTMKVYALGGLSLNLLNTRKPEAIIGGGVVVPESTLREQFVAVSVGTGIQYYFGRKLVVSPEIRISLREDSYFRFGVSMQYIF